MTECKWKEEGDRDFDIYDTSCDQIHQFIDGTPKDNDFKYCPYCGGKLIDITEEKS